MHVGEQKTKELIRGTTMPTVHMTHLFSEQRELLLLLPFGEFLDTAATARYVLQRARRSASSGGGRSP